MLLVLGLLVGPLLTSPAQAESARELPQSARNIEQIAPGLRHLEFSCSVNGHPMEFEELRQDPGHGIELRAFQNPSAVRNQACKNSYGGRDLPALLRSKQGLPPLFDPLGATNGTLFRVVDRKDRNGEITHGYVSNHLLWTQGSGMIAPLRRPGGPALFVADPRGGHEIRVNFESCGRNNTCARLAQPYPPELKSAESRAPFARALPGPELIAALKTAYPAMTLVIQSNMSFSGGKIQDGQFNHYTRCPTDETGRPRSGDWRCNRSARTLLCGRADGSVSLITTSGAYPLDVAQGLRPHGGCQAECELLYNLDGGGSTQMGYRSKSEVAENGWIMSGRKTETTQPGCSPYRPVDHYLVFGKTKRTR